jgi:hypothetical protein
LDGGVEYVYDDEYIDINININDDEYINININGDDGEIWKSEGASIRCLLRKAPPLIFNPLVSNNTAAPPNNVIFLSSSLYFQLMTMTTMVYMCKV